MDPKELLEHLKSPNFNVITSIKSFDFSPLYTTIPHQKLPELFHSHKLTSHIQTLVLCLEGPYFVQEHPDSKSKFTEDDIVNMLEFLVDNIFVVFGGKVFQQIIDIPMGTNIAPLLDDIFLQSYEAEFIQFFLSTGKKELIVLSSTSDIDTSMTYCQLIIQILRIIWSDVSP